MKTSSTIILHKISHLKEGRIFFEVTGFKDNSIPIAFGLLMEELKEEIDSDKYKYIKKDIDLRINGQIGIECYSLPTELGSSLLELINAIRESLQQAYNKGKSDGKQILFQLNNGEISINDFDKK